MVEGPTTDGGRGEAALRERRLRLVVLPFVCILVGFGPHAFPLPFAAPEDPCAVWDLRCGLSLFAAVAILWISEVIPLSLTALMVPLVAALYRVVPLEDSLPSFAHPLILLFLGGFALATALRIHGLDQWCASRLLAWSGSRFLSFAFFLFAITALVSMWISNTATTAMMLPLALGLLGAMPKGEDTKRHAIFLLLGLAYSASIGGLATIVGSPPNGIVAQQLGLSFVEWMSFGVPAVLVLMPAMVGVLWCMLRPGNLRLAGVAMAAKMPASGAPVLVIFLATALLWAGGGWLGPVIGIGEGYDTLVSLVAVCALVSGGFISWKQFEEGTPWGVLLLFGGGLALGLVLKATGTNRYLAENLVGLTAGLPTIAMIGMVVLFTIFLTELASNTAVAALMVPVFAAGADSLGIPAPALLVPLGLAASCAFMFPVATPPNALVHGTGLVPQRQMVRVGLVLNFVCTGLLTLFAWLWL